MSSRTKLGNLLASKAVTAPKLQERSSRPKQSRVIQFVTLGNTQYINRQPAVVNRMHRVRKNHTEVSRSAGKSETVIFSRANAAEKRYASISQSRSMQLRQEQERENRLLALREQKLSRLKDLYSMKTKKRNFNMQGDQVTFSNAKINSFIDKPHRRASQVIKHKSKEGLLFKKQEDFHYNNENKGHSQRSLPKYLDYCEQIDHKEGRKHMPEQREHELPQILQPQHLIGKVKSMKKMPETPPLMPVTIRNSAAQQPILTLEQFKHQYVFKLQAFEDINKSTFQSRTLRNGTYFGQINSQKQLEGRGVIFYSNGKIFEGHFKKGQREGLGYELFPDKSFYLGNFKAGKRQGRGKFQWSNGQVYDGEWKANLKAGSGIWKGANGQSYVGEWQQDSMEGFGVLTDHDSRYEGEFKNYMKWGSGTLRFNSGQVYTGTFKQNMPNGQGDYHWTNQDHYHGEFVNGKRHGQGVIRYSNGGVYQGQFQNDKKSGKGQEYYQDNLYYEGDFENDFRHGVGKLLCDGKVIFQGYWINNSAVDPRKGKIQTIIQERQSVLDSPKPHKLDRHQSYLSKVRSRQQAKRQQINNVFKVGKYTPPKAPQHKSSHKTFHRACNCERHRRKRMLLS